MADILSYHVYVTSKGGRWLADDEHSWTRDFHSSTQFTSAQLANEIGQREGERTGEAIFVMGCCATP